jgi:hypothetical protein
MKLRGRSQPRLRGARLYRCVQLCAQSLVTPYGIIDAMDYTNQRRSGSTPARPAGKTHPGSVSRTDSWWFQGAVQPEGLFIDSGVERTAPCSGGRPYSQSSLPRGSRASFFTTTHDFMLPFDLLAGFAPNHCG